MVAAWRVEVGQVEVDQDAGVVVVMAPVMVMGGVEAVDP